MTLAQLYHLGQEQMKADDPKKRQKRGSLTDLAAIAQKAKPKRG